LLKFLGAAYNQNALPKAKNQAHLDSNFLLTFHFQPISNRIGPIAVLKRKPTPVAAEVIALSKQSPTNAPAS